MTQSKGILFQAEVLNPGIAQAPALVLDEALSFWGGFDPVYGRIIDRHHPQSGLSISGRILVMPGSRGSAGTPAGVAESLRRGVGPMAILLRRADVNITIGAMVADRLYGSSTPVLALEREDYASLCMGIKENAGRVLVIAREGTIKLA